MLRDSVDAFELEWIFLPSAPYTKGVVGRPTQEERCTRYWSGEEFDCIDSFGMPVQNRADAM